MKKTLLLVATVLGFSASSIAQAVSDRATVPVAVNLNQVLRLSINDGGNIEFTFNTIEDYRNGISGGTVTGVTAPASNQYTTDFTVASSTQWVLRYGAESAAFVGTDNPTNTLALNNVGYTLEPTGNHIYNGATAGAGQQDNLASTPVANSATQIADLDQYPTILLEQTTTGTPSSNAGDVTDNSFRMVWRCGTVEGDMNTTSILEQGNIDPDRYAVNVVFELNPIL